MVNPVGPRHSILGGNTEFADMRAAYDALDERIKRLVEEPVCHHSQTILARRAASLNAAMRSGKPSNQSGNSWYGVIRYWLRVFRQIIFAHKMLILRYSAPAA